MAHKKSRKGKQSSTPHGLVKGRLDVTRSGAGYVIVEGREQDIYVKRNNLGAAMGGDTVRIELLKEGRHGNRAEGVVREVVERRRTEFSGRLEVHDNYAFFVAEGDDVPVDFFIPLHLLHGGKDGDRAIVRLIEWNEKAKNPIGEVVSLLGASTPNDAAMVGILVDAGFPLHFPDEVIEEAARFSEVLDEDEIARRRDFRDVLTLTIDPVDAKDFDDALSFRDLGNGWYEVGVHIADVSHYMQPGSALDKEAARRTTSVYLPDRVLPMLPEHLSNGLCSLRPDEDKYTFSAVFVINEKGTVKESWLGRTAIRSARRFTYEEVQEIIEGADGDHRDVLLLLNRIARVLREKRFTKGAINFSSQEVRFKLDEEARPVAVVVKESKEAHQLIEEWMLLANRTVAEYVAGFEKDGKPLPFPYRVHDSPDEAKLGLFAAFAARYGHKFDLNTPAAIASSFNEMLQLVQGKPEQHVLESLGIRTMAKAVYTTENIGHYGLGFEHYCHFTSPIRRYPDVLVHRILQDCLDGAPRPVKGLEQVCRQCSDGERNAMEAERAANKYKQVEFMTAHVGEDFDAVVSGVSTFGFWAETVEHKCEGLVGMAELSDLDNFEYAEGEYALIGRHTGLSFRMGDKLRVRVLAANLDKRQIDYGLAEAPQTRRGKTPKESKRVDGARRGQPTEKGVEKKRRKGGA